MYTHIVCRHGKNDVEAIKHNGKKWINEKHLEKLLVKKFS